MPKFRKKPTTIEAEQFREVGPLPQGILWDPAFGGNWPYVLTAHEQKVYLVAGDWVVPEPGFPGRYYPIKDSVMRATYEPVDEPTEPMMILDGPIAGGIGLSGHQRIAEVFPPKGPKD